MPAIDVELIDVVKFIFVLAVMIPACVSDWRKREASDMYWIVIGIFGIVMMSVTSFLDEFRLEYAMMILGSVMILIDLFWETERSNFVSIIFYSLIAAMFILPLISAWDDPIVMQFILVPAAFLIFVGMFMAGIVKGGADAKCLIVLAMVFQTYPVFSIFPLIAVPDSEITMIFQFALMVLFHAALFSLFVGLYYIAVNVKNKETEKPFMFLGFKMNIQDAKRSHVWPMQKIVDGNVIKTRTAQDPDTFHELEKAGEERIWVTAMIPFLIPITVAFIFITFVGNLLFLIPF